MCSSGAKFRSTPRVGRLPLPAERGRSPAAVNLLSRKWLSSSGPLRDRRTRTSNSCRSWLGRRPLQFASPSDLLGDTWGLAGEADPWLGVLLRAREMTTVRCSPCGPSGRGVLLCRPLSPGLVHRQPAEASMSPFQNDWGGTPLYFLAVWLKPDLMAKITIFCISSCVEVSRLPSELRRPLDQGFSISFVPRIPLYPSGTSL